ncbi:ATP synthase subunit epsilon, mitochondrial [Hoplias malabaricus]|uniref:ATP synthase subunit epsilon, mitochondrial n=1 Tax=Hoplias malabaricus TaxID=27720 RepID=UPI003463609C
MRFHCAVMSLRLCCLSFAVRLCSSLRGTGIMVSYWRQAGLSYIRYSAICARVVRAALKPQFRTEAVRNAESSVKVTKLKTA